MPAAPRQLFYALALAACLAAAPAMAQSTPAPASGKAGMSAQEILQKAISQALDNIRAQNPKVLTDDAAASATPAAAGDDDNTSIPTPTMAAKPPVAPTSPLSDLLAPPSINAPAPPVMVAPKSASGGARPRTIVLPDAQDVATQQAEQPLAKIPPLPPIPDCSHGQVLSSHNGHLICVDIDQPAAAPSTPQQDCPAASLSVFIGGESIHIHFEVPYTPNNGQSRSDRRKFQITAVCHNGLYSLVSVVRKECGGQVCMPGMIPADSVTFYCKPTITTTCYAKRDDGRLNPNLGITARLENQF